MIYCVEDDKNIRDLVVYALKTSGYEANGYGDSVAFFEALEKKIPDLVLLDIMLPGDDGLQILEKIRQRHDTKSLPVIMLTAKGSEYDKVNGLEMGADDYVSKPFGVMELLARVKAVLRRSAKEPEQDVIEIGDLALHLKKHRVLVNGEDIKLTFKEFELLKHMMENRGIVMTRESLLKAIWGYDYEGETRTVDVHIKTLRQKIGDMGSIIETVRGVGYRIGEDI